MPKMKKRSFYTFYNSDYRTPTFNIHTLYLMADWMFKKNYFSLKSGNGNCPVLLGKM